MSLLTDLTVHHVKAWRHNGPFEGYADEDAYVREKVNELTPYELVEAITDAMDEQFDRLMVMIDAASERNK